MVVPGRSTGQTVPKVAAADDDLVFKTLLSLLLFGMPGVALMVVHEQGIGMKAKQVTSLMQQINGSLAGSQQETGNGLAAFLIDNCCGHAREAENGECTATRLSIQPGATCTSASLIHSFCSG
jgi:hypothetical protein